MLLRHRRLGLLRERQRPRGNPASDARLRLVAEPLRLRRYREPRREFYEATGLALSSEQAAFAVEVGRVLGVALIGRFWSAP